MVMMRECDQSQLDFDEIFNGSLIPTQDNIFSIGSDANRVHDLFLGGTLHMNGENILFEEDLTGVADNIATLAAAGATIADAAQIVATVTRVTGANGALGVKLPLLADVPVGFKMRVINSSTASALLLYSAAAGELISGQAGSTAISIAAKLTVFIQKYDATNWYLAKGVLPY